MLVIPSEKIYLSMKYISDESFFFDYDSSGILVLYLKLFPSIATSVINGASINIVFLHPLIEKNNITLFIYDIIDSPFYISKIFNDENNILMGFSSIYSYFESINL